MRFPFEVVYLDNGNIVWKESSFTNVMHEDGRQWDSITIGEFRDLYGVEVSFSAHLIFKWNIHLAHMWFMKEGI